MSASSIKGCCIQIMDEIKTGWLLQSINSLLPSIFLQQSFSKSIECGISSLKKLLNKARPICCTGSICTLSTSIRKILMSFFAITANISFHAITWSGWFCLTKTWQKFYHKRVAQKLSRNYLKMKGIREQLFHVHRYTLTKLNPKQIHQHIFLPKFLSWV